MRCLEEGISGLEFLVGVPGTIGGAVAMNAGAYGSEVKDLLRWVELMDEKGNEVVAALSELGYSVKSIDVQRNLPKLLQELEEVKPEIVFNALHGVGGEDGVIQGVLEMLQIPYTHCGLQEGHPMEMPYVIKPIGEGSSRGVTLVFNETDYQQSIKEWNFAVIDDKAIGAIEIKPLQGFYDYTAKYTPGKAEHIMPAPLTPDAYQEVLELAEKAHKALGCHGVTRSDFRYDDTTDNPKFYILELNTQPGMTPLSLVPEIAAYVGISFKDLLEKKIKAARSYAYLGQKTVVLSGVLGLKIDEVFVEGRIVISTPVISYFRHLPVVVGTDAPVRAPQILATLEKFPKVREKLSSLVRIRQRRWDLTLDNTIQVKLPEDKVEDALARLDPSFNGTLSPITARSVLSSVENRLDETRDLSLLGTFWGLSETIGAITGVINGIDMGSGDVKNAFSHLKEGLQSPLSGMGMAFSSSMFGLASSLIIGFLDLQNTKASSEFFHNLEDRLAINTKISGSSEAAATGSGPAYSMGLLEQTIESMANLQTQMRRSEDNRLSVIKSMQTLNEKLALMADQITAHQTVIKKIAQNQVDLQENIIQMSKNPAGGAHDEAIKHLLRNLDATSTKMLEELVEGRNRSTQELRTEIRVIARTLSAIANGQEIAA
eukprot:gene17170-17363_t